MGLVVLTTCLDFFPQFMGTIVVFFISRGRATCI